MATITPRRTFITVLHLLVFSVFGTAIVGGFVSLVATGIATIPLIGVGILLLVGAIYVAFGLGWFEVERVSGVYRLDASPLTLRRAETPGFAGWLKTVAKQSVDGRMWRGIGSFALTTLLGLVLTWWISTAMHISSILAEVMSISTRWWTIAFLSLVGGLLILVGAVLLAWLSQLSSTAIITAGAKVQVLEAQREGAVRAADVERTRIERDLHDGVQPRLVSVAMTLGLAHEQIDTDPAAAKELVAEAHTSTKAAITELRQLARGIYASVLDDRGLDAALSALAARSHIPVHLDVQVDTRVNRDAEAAVYFAIAESLTNAAKHSCASECRVTVRQRVNETGQPILWARIDDNGIGGATVSPGGGLDGVIHRVQAAGGTSRLESPIGGPTTLEVSVPCA